jgi:hypothetical protein
MGESIKEIFLTKIELDAYNEYLNAKKDNQVVFEKVINQNQGFMYVKQVENGYGIRISHSQEINEESRRAVINVVKDYVQNKEETVYVIINARNNETINNSLSI